MGESSRSNKPLPAGCTDPNSLYRKLYNRDLAFFQWVIDREQGPILIKIHV